MDDACIFCKIASGAIPSEKIYEEDDTLAFLDIKPNNPGHTLVIPKAHYRNVFDIPKATWLAVMATVHRLAPAIKEATGASGVNIVANNEPAAHQLVFHTHVHIIPRHAGDPHKPWVGTPYTEGEAEKIGNDIRTKLAGTR